MGKNGKNYNGKSGGVGFLITLGIAFLISHSIPAVLVGAVIGAGVAAVTGIMGSKLDTTTHNKRDIELQQLEEERKRHEEERKRREAASRIPLTGDETADAVIMKGQEMLRTIQTENAMIPDQTLSAQMDTLAEKCRQIFRTVYESPSKAPQVRKFMNYYLPTTLKMLANYRTMQQRGVSYQEMNQARDTAVRGMNMVLTACQKQIDNLHKENMLDISTDIDVMEQMLKRDGYTENEITGNKEMIMNSQVYTSSAPVMDFPVEEENTSSPSSSSARHEF